MFSLVATRASLPRWERRLRRDYSSSLGWLFGLSYDLIDSQASFFKINEKNLNIE